AIAVLSSARATADPLRDVGMGLSLPTYLSGPVSIGWWAMLITLLADQAAFVTLVFSEFYYWTVSIPYPPPGTPAPSTVLLVTALLLGAAAWSLVATARRLLTRERPGPARLALLTGAAVSLPCAAALAASRHDPRTHPTSRAGARKNVV